MTKPKTKKTSIKTQPFSKVLPEIRSLIETSRRHVATTANLVLVNLYWNIGRVITQDIQNNEKRAGYGKQLLERLAEILTREYGKGFSVSNLNDMRRFFELFQILQAVPVGFETIAVQPALSDECGKVVKSQALPDELPPPKTPNEPSQKRQAPPAEFNVPITICTTGDVRK